MSLKKKLEHDKSDGVEVRSPYFNDFSGSNKKTKLTYRHNNKCLNSTFKPVGPRVGLPFFNVQCEVLAKALLGSVLVRLTHANTLLRGIIVETESYLGGEDKASLSFGGKITERSKPMYMTPGTTFVYLTYGMYNLINISSKGKVYYVYL